MNESPEGRNAWPRETGGPDAPGLFQLAGSEVAASLRWIVIAALLAALGGGVLGLVLPKSYTATATFIPSRQGGDNFGGLNALAGGVLGVLPGGSAESPVFYARLVRSHDVLRQVIASPFEAGDLAAYFEVDDGAGREEKLIRELRDAMSVSVDRIPGIVRVDVTLGDAKLAAEVAAALLQEVDRFNSSIHRTSAGEKRRFLEGQVEASGAQLKAAEGEMELFLQQNRVIDSPVLENRRATLQRRIQVAQDLYLALSRQLQTARVEELNTTPVISVIDAPYPPTRASAPRPVFMAFVAAVIAGLLAVLIVLWLRRDRWLLGTERAA